MFGIGPTELIVILVIALLVLGPKRLPELAAGLGKGLAEFRRATSDINAELDEARRAVEEPAREASRTTQPEKRVSRGARRAERPTRFGASGEASEAEASEAEASSGEQTAPDPAGIDDDSGPTPKAPA